MLTGHALAQHLAHMVALCSCLLYCACGLHNVQVMSLCDVVLLHFFTSKALLHTSHHIGCQLLWAYLRHGTVFVGADEFWVSSCHLVSCIVARPAAASHRN